MMKLIRVNPNNAIYYPEYFVKGFECGAKRQLEADERSIPKGHWIEHEVWDGDRYYGCSVCGASFTLIDGTPNDNGYNYCPHCNADMRGEACERDTDYEQAVSQLEHDMRYDPTYNPEDGSA